jgi:hypothetical protein
MPLFTATDNGDIISQQLMNDGNHFNDLEGKYGRYNRQRWYNFISKTSRVPLPHDQLDSYIASIGETQVTVN